jgi:hypothetical protein
MPRGELTMTTIRVATDAAAEEAIITFERAGESYARLVGREMDLEADRHAQKQAAIRRVMQGINELTAKPHSASSAEAIVETDLEYRDYLRQQTDTVVQKNLALTAAQSARLRAMLALTRAASDPLGDI